MNPADYSSHNNDSIIPVNNESILPSTHESIYLVGINSNELYKQLQKSIPDSSVKNHIAISNKEVIEGFDTTPCSGDSCFTKIDNNIADISLNFAKLQRNEINLNKGFIDLSYNIDSYNIELNKYISSDPRTYAARLVDKTPTLKDARRDDTEKLLEQEKIFYALGSITAVSLLIGAILLAKK
jgi:hypothetical protein